MAEESLEKGGPSRSAQRSQRLISDAYVRLMKEGRRPSVTSVCREADINRSTFYAHYTDLADFEEQLTRGLFKELLAIVSPSATPEFLDDPHEVIEGIGRYFEKNADLLRLVFSSGHAAQLILSLMAGSLTSETSLPVCDLERMDFVSFGIFGLYWAWLLGRYGSTPIDELNDKAVQWVLAMREPDA